MARAYVKVPMMRVTCARAITAAFWFLTAAYCLLSAIPFASEQFLKPGLSPALTLFAGWHPWIAIAALASAAAVLAPWLRSGHRSVQALTLVWAVVAVALFILPPVSRLEPSTTALTLALLSLVPPVWISLIDFEKSPKGGDSREPDLDDRHGVSRDFAACAAAAVVVTIAHAMGSLPIVSGLGPMAAAFGFVRSLLMHLVVFSAVFAAISIVRGASRMMSDREAVEAWIARGLLACVLAVFIAVIVLRPLSLAGVSGILLAGAFGAALAVSLGPRGTSARGGVERALGALVPAWALRSKAAAVAWLVAIVAAVWLVERRAAAEDWNFTLAKTAALASWLLALAACLRVVQHGRARSPLAPFAFCFVLLGLNAAASRGPARLMPAADAWKAGDPSMRLIADALAPAAPVLDGGLETLLQQHTNIPRGVTVDPVSIDLAPLSGAPGARRPHIFLFVIDSLRRDYLSPYNHAVAFTPAIDRFAHESTVFERAFTRYGATGLSVPSMWIGGLLLHKQYVTPFAPMNSLAKLLEHEQYRQWIGMDNILDVILPASSRREPLDVGRQVSDYRFCRTLGEVRGRLDRLQGDVPPTFVYSLPQDVHVSVITREGASPVDGESYGSFYAPYASRVRRLDACFGEFIDDLKARGLFDQSIVILTADHGDSLGEQGRMGHAYTLFPEIVQVPLIVHLPADRRAELRADPSAPAFTTDITPTLYSLLGHEPLPPAPFFGHPLFHSPTIAAPARPHDPEMAASSYGAVYGTFLADARRLYIFDGIALREYSYELDGTGPGRAVPIRDADRALGQRTIRSTVEAIARFYHYRPAGQSSDAR